jgi:hypothetical protein
MGWMDLNEYFMMEAAARDRLNDLRRTLHEDDVRAGAPCSHQPSLVGAALAAVGLRQAGPRERRCPDPRRRGADRRVTHHPSLAAW